MFKRAQLKLTLLYSALFFILFWSFSFGLYEWMHNSFGESYISQVHERQGLDSDANANNAKVVTIAGDVALDQLRSILFVLNGVLIIIIPGVSWFLAGRTLSPIQQSHEQQKQFVSDASHEMRTPLSIISGEIEVALQKKRTAAEYKQTLKSTKEETDRLSRLSEQLLFLASSDAYRRSQVLENVDLTELVSSVVHSLQSKIRQKHLKISLHTESETVPVVLGNGELLHQLFYNLINNAATYTPSKGTVSVSIKDEGEYVVIAVSDNGIGIDKREQEKIFDRFYRTDKSRSGTKGYGLGLAIANVIVAGHKGSLRVNSALHKGSTFTVTLPKK